MSDAYTDTSPQDDSESIKCRVCNQSKVLVVVHPWKGDPIIVEPTNGHMFMLLPGTTVRVQNRGSHIQIRLFGDPVPESGGILKKVELHLSADTALDLAAEDLLQITLQRFSY